ncbi:MAG: histidine phosphatase family protein [Gemmatimonadales bacterium]
MTTFLLIRHCLCDPVGRSIAGRSPGVHLNSAGRAQADALAARLATLPIAAIYSSPLERARETADPIATRLGLPVITAPGFSEIDFGDWTGRALEELRQVPAWEAFNSSRSRTRIPGGETMAEVLRRSLAEVERIRCGHVPEALVAVVSHGDVLRVLVAHSLGISLDLLDRFEVGPGSVSVLSVERQGSRLLLLNSTEGSLNDSVLRSAR